MFKIIKKWYFKIYHLFKLLGIFILIFGLKERVYAEEYKTCFDKYKIGTVSFESQSAYWNYILPVLPVTETSTTYYVRFFPNENFTGYNNVYFSSSPKAVHTDGTLTDYYIGNMNFDVNNQILSFKTTSNLQNIIGIKQLIYTFRSNYTVLKDSPVIMSTNIEDVTTCEDIPEPSDNVYSNFLSLYTEKLEYLANGFTNNPYLLAMIGIIFSFIVLEITLKLFKMRGGK